MHNEPTPVTFRTLIQNLLNVAPIDHAQSPVSNDDCEPEIRTEVNHEIINNYLRSAIIHPVQR